jgi:hypothetical protein
VKHESWTELVRTLRAMPLLYWLMVATGIVLSVLYFSFDCLLRPVCR